MSRHGTLLVVLGAATWLVAAPGVAASKEMRLLQADVDEIQRQVFELKRLLEEERGQTQELLAAVAATPEARRGQANLFANLETLLGEVRALATRFNRVEERLAGLERRLERPAPASDEGAVAPGDDGAAAASGSGGEADPARALFGQARSDYLKDDFELAVAEFGDFLSRHPDHPLAEEAQYFLGMSHFNQRQWQAAVDAFDALLVRYPHAGNMPDALYRKGLALLELNRLGQAVLVFNQVMDAHPSTPAAEQARQRLKELAEGTR
jgi:tol-pal system protein YbgF